MQNNIDFAKVLKILLCVLAVVLIIYLWNRMLYYKELAFYFEGMVHKYEDLFEYLKQSLP